MKRRTFLALVAMAKHAAAAWGPARPAVMTVALAELPSSLNRYLYGRQWIDMRPLVLDPPPCLAFPGGAFTRALHAETERLIHDMQRTEERFISWMDRPHKGPRGRVRRSPGNLCKRLRKQERRRRWHR